MPGEYIVGIIQRRKKKIVCRDYQDVNKSYLHFYTNKFEHKKKHNAKTLSVLALWHYS